MLIHERKKKEVIMEIRIQAINFDASEHLEAFIQKKVSKLQKFYDDTTMSADVTLKITKPESAKNKKAGVLLNIKHGECFAEKQSDTFEESIDECIKAVEKQLIKMKEKIRAK